MSDEQVVRDNFWTKARQTLGKVPFTEDAVAAFYCATDAATPMTVRATLFGALAYFVLPFDIIPDFIPVLGLADDAIIVTFVLRSVVRRAGVEAVRTHWPGTPEGFALVARLAGLPAE